MLTVNELLDIAKVELVNLESDEIFLFRDLFKGYEWNRISRRNRLLLGTLFLKSNVIGIVPIEKISLGRRNI
ncbi:hypothetical protein SDC9_57236 [bioreactor metagenome]|uniref:DUF1413 domain-containing protein n=1 Tax=bioreactor metagenome TaxID=1076179 RepID=A0A644X4D5_9ZZZZ